MGTLTNIMKGVVMISLIATGFFYFYTGGVEQYAPTDYNDTQLQAFRGTLNTINATVNETAEKVFDIAGDFNLFDIIGGIFSIGYGALISMVQSFGSLLTIVDTGLSTVPFLSAFAGELKLALITLILIAIIGALFKAIFKVDL